MESQLSGQIARDLLIIEAVSLSPTKPFTWTSGIKSPIYCDNRLTLSYPEVRNTIADGLAALVKLYYPNVTVIAGTATAGIPHAALVSERLNLPMVYIRSSAKQHGKGNQIEGKLTAGDKVVVIEDLISTGGSVINAASALRRANIDVLGVAAIFSYGLNKGLSLLKEAALEVYTLTNLDVLLSEAVINGTIDRSGEEMIRNWRNNPDSSDWFIQKI